MNKPNYNAKLKGLHMEMMMGNLLRIFMGIAAMLVVLEFILHRHGKIDIENIPLFPALFALIGVVVVIGLTHGVKAVLTRKIDYYDRPDTKNNTKGGHDD